VIELRQSRPPKRFSNWYIRPGVYTGIYTVLVGSGHKETATT